MTEAKKEPSAIVVPFGKHKGATVAELLAKDPSYADWILAQGWVAERFAELHAAIMTRGAGTDDTPEHNAIQVRFLDPVFQCAFLGAATADRLAEEPHRKAVKRLTESMAYARGELERGYHGYREYHGHRGEPPRPEEWLANWRLHREQSLQKEAEEIAQCQKKLDSIVEPLPLLKTTASFEIRGVDVILSWVWAVAEEYPDPDWYGGKCGIELKPSVGDDYPTVMRQMQRLGAPYLVLEEYTGRAVSFPDLRRMFQANGQQVVLTREIEAEIASARHLIGDAS